MAKIIVFSIMLSSPFLIPMAAYILFHILDLLAALKEHKVVKYKKFTLPLDNKDPELKKISGRIKTRYNKTKIINRVGVLKWLWAYFMYFITIGKIEILTDHVYEVDMLADGKLCWEMYWGYERTRYNDEGNINHLYELPDHFPRVLKLLEKDAQENRALVTTSVALLEDKEHLADRVGALAIHHSKVVSS